MPEGNLMDCSAQWLGRARRGTKVLSEIPMFRSRVVGRAHWKSPLHMRGHPELAKDLARSGDTSRPDKLPLTREILSKLGSGLAGTVPPNCTSCKDASQAHLFWSRVPG